MAESFDVGSVVAHIKADLTDFQNGMKNAKDSANGFKDTLGGIGDGIKNFGQSAAIFTGLVGGALVLFGKQSLDAFNESEKVNAQLDAVLKSTASVMNQQEKSTTTTKLSAKATADLSEKLKESEAKLHDMENRWKSSSTHTETAAIQIQKTKDEVAKLSAELGHAGDQMTTHFIPPTQMSKDALINLSKSLQDTTTFSDEAVLSAENLLLTFTNIGKDTFPEATKTVLDMSTALGEDTKSASIQLGKALQDPILGVTALRRVGVNFNEDQTKLIKKLVESGKTMDAQKMILKELNTEFGGSAAAAADTFGGKVEQLKNKFNDLQEKIGAIIAGVATFMATGNLSGGFLRALGIDEDDPRLKGLIVFREKMVQLSEWLQANKDMVITALTGIGIAVGTLMIIGTISALIFALLNPLTLVGAGIAALYMAWQTNFMGFRDITQRVVTEIQNFFTNYLMPLIETFKNWWTAHWEYIKLELQGVWEIMKGIVEVAWALIYGIIKVGIDIMTGNWKKAGEDLINLLKNAWNGVVDILKGAIDFVDGWAGMMMSKLTKPFEDAWHNIQDTMNKIKGALDFTQRHSPSVVDIVENGVSKVNDALKGLSMPNINLSQNVSSSSIGQTLSPGLTNNQIYLDMSGAIISDQQGARDMGEKIGDAIIGKLQMNMRI